MISLFGFYLENLLENILWVATDTAAQCCLLSVRRRKKQNEKPIFFFGLKTKIMRHLLAAMTR